MISRKISYSRQSELYIYNLEDRTVTVFNNTPLMRASAWHPDGVHIAYGVDTIYNLDTQTGTVEQISGNEVRATYPAWHPQGQLLLYTVDDQEANGRLCLHNLATGQKRYLELGLQAALQADWHPDGRTIVFVGVKDGSKHLFKLNLDCLEQGNCAEACQQLTDEGRFNHAPAWSPDGQWIAFERYLEPVGQWAIMLMDGQGRQLKQLTPSAINGHHPAWSGDGQHLVFEQENEDAPSYLCLIKPDGADYEILREEGGLEPDWF